VIERLASCAEEAPASTSTIIPAPNIRAKVLKRKNIANFSQNIFCKNDASKRSRAQ
jgi:hypothetical protein